MGFDHEEFSTPQKGQAHQRPSLQARLLLGTALRSLRNPRTAHIDISHFAYSMMGGFYLLAIVNNIFKKICVLIPAQVLAFRDSRRKRLLRFAKLMI